VNGVVYSGHPSIFCLDVDGSATMVDPKPTFSSIAFSCPAGPFRTTDNDQPTAPQALFTAGPNNIATGYTPTFSQVFINGSNESGRVATNPTPFSSFLQSAGFIAAVSGPNDNWYVGWTCGLAGAASC
jgi:hypothetical protein